MFKLNLHIQEFLHQKKKFTNLDKVISYSNWKVKFYVVLETRMVILRVRKYDKS